VYDFDREQHIEDSLEAQGFRPVAGKAKQEWAGDPCRVCGKPTKEVAQLYGKPAAVCSDCTRRIREEV
jgi:hypothetical protein